MFDSGELALVLLHLLEAQPRHGYDLIRAVETLTGGVYAPSPGIVYPTLTLLEELGQVTAQVADEAKRVFGLTALGQARLTDEQAVLDGAMSRLKGLSEPAERSDGAFESGPVWRALKNLDTVLQQRLGPATEKSLLFEIADAIDEAARKIERL